MKRNLILGLILYCLLISMFIQLFNEKTIKSYSEVFNNFSLGIAALLGGLGGLKILSELADQMAYKRKIRKWRAIYDPSLRGVNFRLIRSRDNPNWIYVHDLNSNEKIHIGSRLTFDEFGFIWDWIEDISHDDFIRIRTSDEIILTRGEFGS